MKIIDNLATNLKLLRETNGYSQEDLAHKSGLHRTYISGIERKRRNPTVSIIQELALALEVSPCELIKDKK
jgi:transcriptional regulator with XRE-family HTH domain